MARDVLVSTSVKSFVKMISCIIVWRAKHKYDKMETEHSFLYDVLDMKSCQQERPVIPDWKYGEYVMRIAKLQLQPERTSYIAGNGEFV